MARKPGSKNRASDDSAQDVEGNVDKIRQILFGGQMRDYEQRFDAMEKRLTQAVERSSREIERRLERLDTYARREIDKVNEQIKLERKDRTADGKKSNSELQGLIEQVETWFAEVDEQLAGEAKELRQALVDQNEELSTLIGETHDELSEQLHKEAGDLASNKLARDDLAALFKEFALRLNKDFKLPKG